MHSIVINFLNFGDKLHGGGQAEGTQWLARAGSLLNENSCDELGGQPAWDMLSAKAVYVSLYFIFFFPLGFYISDKNNGVVEEIKGCQPGAWGW